MKRLVIVFCILGALSLNILAGEPSIRKATGIPQPIAAAQEVLKRVIGKHADQFRLVLLPPDGNNDAFEVEAAGGTVTVRGSNAVALTRGAYHYLRAATHSQVTWSGKHLNISRILPNFPKVRVTSPFEYRLYYNVCAFGYTTAFWGWKEWERELDWMALHGINMPLSCTASIRWHSD